MKTDVDKNADPRLLKIQELIKGIGVAMLCTTAVDGSLRSRPMATQQVDFDGDLWFFCGADSAKVFEVQEHAQANVAFSDASSNRYVSVSGRAVVIRNRAKAKELWNPILKAWFPKGLEDPELALLRVIVEDAEYWDSPSSKMVHWPVL